MECLWPFKSQDFLPCIYLILVRLHLGDWGDTKGPHLDSVGSYLPFLFNQNNCVCWFLTKMMTFLAASQPRNTDTRILQPWQLAARGRAGGRTEGLPLVRRQPSIFSPYTGGKSVLGSPALQLDALETSWGIMPGWTPGTSKITFRQLTSLV